MADLRQEMIEAAAATIWNDLPRYELSYPECEHTVKVALDAFLDVLEEQQTDWLLAMAEQSGSPLQRLIAALRSGTSDG